MLEGISHEKPIRRTNVMTKRKDITPGELPGPHQPRRHKELCGCLVLDSTTAIDYWLEQFE